MKSDKPQNDQTANGNASFSASLTYGAGLGIVFGAALGTVLGNIGVGVALGLVFGAALGQVYDMEDKDRSTQKT